MVWDQSNQDRSASAAVPSMHGASVRAHMMEWWNDIQMLCVRYLVTSDALECLGPVVAAVCAVDWLPIFTLVLVIF
jgi:hypothetical protein